MNGKIVKTIVRNRIWLNEKSLYESMIVDAPKSAQGYVGLAYWYYNREDIIKASLYLQKGQEIYADHPRLLNLDAALSFRSGDLDAAEEATIKSINLLPGPVNHLMYAIILTEKREFEKSLDIIGRFIDSPFYGKDEQTTMTIRYLAALNLHRMGKVEEAKQYFDLDSIDLNEGASRLSP